MENENWRKVVTSSWPATTYHLWSGAAQIGKTERRPVILDGVGKEMIHETRNGIRLEQFADSIQERRTTAKEREK